MCECLWRLSSSETVVKVCQSLDTHEHDPYTQSSLKCQPEASLVPAQFLNFDIYSEAGDDKPDPLADALAIVDQIKDEISIFRSKYDIEVASQSGLMSPAALDCRNGFVELVKRNL